jgi:isopentenyl-diphosphate Delta-isomerase
MTSPEPNADPSAEPNIPAAPAPAGEELFDVVDELDRVIGRERRREVHRLGLKHRAVHVLVFNARGEVFLQKRSMTKDTAPGAWDSSAAGHVDCGEDYDAAAVRELKEELGLDIGECPAKVLKIEPCAETGQEHVWVYRCESEGPFTLHPEEIESGRWISPAELTRWRAERPGDFAESFLLIWDRVIKKPSGLSFSSRLNQ